jgi:hypothetical protein
LGLGSSRSRTVTGSLWSTGSAGAVDVTGPTAELEDVLEELSGATAVAGPTSIDETTTSATNAEKILDMDLIHLLQEDSADH